MRARITIVRDWNVRSLEILVMLVGGDKLTQQKDINKAIEMAKEI